MKLKYLYSLFIFLIVYICSSAMALSDTKYAIMLDAGSSGSRVHLFCVHSATEQGKKPDIQEINFYGKNSNKSKIPISSTNLNKPLETFQQPFSLALNYLFNTLSVTENNISVFVYSTAGMRVLEETTRDGINDAVKNELKKQYPNLAKIDVKTIEGQEEALYLWLDVNYLKGNIASHFNVPRPATEGIIDVGGASAQIAYEENETAISDYKTTHIQIFGQNYNLYLNSILHGGQDQARNKMISNFKDQPNYCYIQSSDASVLSSHFSANECSEEYAQILSSNFTASENPVDKSKIPTPPSEMKFIATSGAYYIYNFFGEQQNSQVSVGQLQSDFINNCNLNWADFKTAFPKFNDNYLSQRCANAVYIHTLLTEAGFKLLDTSNITVSTELTYLNNTQNKADIDWTLGALLFMTNGMRIE